MATSNCGFRVDVRWLPPIPRVEQQQSTDVLAKSGHEEVLVVLVVVGELLKFIYETANKPPPIVWNLRRPDNI